MQSFLPRFVCCLFFLIITLQAAAQIRDNNIFHYQDGSVFIGNILEENSKRTKLRITTGDTISIAKVLVKKSYRDLLYYPNGKFHFTKGLFFNYAVGLGGNNGGVSFQIEAILGKHHNEKLDYGIGLIFHTSETRLVRNGGAWVAHDFLSPVLYTRYYPWSKKVRPFASLALGYSLPLQVGWQRNEGSGGLYMQPSIGLKFASKKLRRYYVSIGQFSQRTKGILNNNDFLGNPVEYNYKLWLNRFVFKVGVELR